MQGLGQVFVCRSLPPCSDDAGEGSSVLPGKVVRVKV